MLFENYRIKETQLKNPCDEWWPVCCVQQIWLEKKPKVKAMKKVCKILSRNGNTLLHLLIWKREKKGPAQELATLRGPKKETKRGIGNEESANSTAKALKWKKVFEWHLLLNNWSIRIEILIYLRRELNFKKTNLRKERSSLRESQLVQKLV